MFDGSRLSSQDKEDDSESKEDDSESVNSDLKSNMPPFFKGANLKEKSAGRRRLDSSKSFADTI